MNKVFWEFVKKIMQEKKIIMKSCHYYKQNKFEVNNKFNSLKNNEISNTKHKDKKI